jgi:hypothetical protein
MTKLKSVEINCTTGEVIETPYTEAELTELSILETQWETEAQTRRDEKEAEEARIANLKASAKTKLIAGEPLTSEEADLLVI